MFHGLRTIFSALILLAGLFSSAALGNSKSCHPLDAKTVSEWDNRLGSDPVQFLIQNLQPLHIELKNSSSPLSRTRQMKVVGKFFDIQTWSDKVAQARGANYQLSGSEQLLMQYLFTTWMRERYIGLLKRTVHRDELAEVKKRPFRLARAVRQRVHSYPAEPRVVGIENYTCSGKWDRHTYDCNSLLFTMEVQASPYLLCGAEMASTGHRLKYLLRKTTQGLRILDVIRGDYHVYQDAYKDYAAYRKKWSANQIKSFLQRVTFTSTASLSPDDGSDFGLFTNLLNRAKINPTSDHRLPASERK